MNLLTGQPTRELFLLAVFVLVFPVVAYVSTFPTQRFRNEITEWGNCDSATYKRFVEYQEKFGINEFVVVTWPGCNLNDPRVQQVTERIEAELADDIQQVSSGLKVYRDLRSRLNLSEAETLKRLRNAGVGDDGMSTAVGFNLTRASRFERPRVIEKLHEILNDADVDPAQASFAGLGHNLYSMDTEGLNSPFRMVPQIVLLAFGLTVLLVRHFWLAFFINVLGIFTGCLAFNFVYLAGVDMNAIIWPLPTLVMLLTVSAALHFLSYFENASRQFLNSRPNLIDETTSLSLQDRRQISHQAFRQAVKPVLCCTLTTALGLLSLLLSSSEPVRQFGYFGAISISAANCLLLLLFPPFLTWSRFAHHSKFKLNEPGKTAPRSRDWQWMVWFTARFRIPIIAIALIAMLYFSIGVPKIETGSNLRNFFPATHKVITDAAQVEASAGPLNSVELLLQFDNVDQQNDRLRVRGIEVLSSRIVADSPFESCISAATFAPQFKRRVNALQKTATNTKLKILKEELVEHGLLHVSTTSDQETWRVSCRFSADRKIDIPEASEQLKSIVNDVFFRDSQMVLKDEQMTTVTTGEFVLFDFVDRQFFRELLSTYAAAFAVISLVVLLVLRAPLAMLIALIPNLFPAVVVLGSTGQLGFRLDVASLMTASVALGIAVDDTLHFMLWWQKEKNSLDSDQSQQQHNSFAIESAMQYCGKAMLQTSLIIGCSIVLYGLCGFLPTVRFGLLLSAMMFAALIGDLILLPALLAKSQQHATRPERIH